MDDLHATLADAVAWTAKAIASTSPADLARPSTCEEWDVATLRTHLVEGVVGFAVAMGGDVADVPAAPPEERYQDAANVLLAELARPGAMQRPAELPIGQVDGQAVLGIALIEAAGHGWDLARSIGQDTTLPTNVAEAALAVAHQAISPQLRPTHFHHPVDVPAGAPVTDRLVGYLGRRP